MRRFPVAAVGCVLLFGVTGSAFADGDPASDFLITQDVFLPYPPPAKDLGADLNKSVRTVYTRGYRIKVALVATAADLGSVPQLFDKPKPYARFLGAELSFAYIGPLLIVMPAGFGIYDGGRSVAAEERVLATLAVDGKSPDALARAAATAVRKLTAAKALRSKDVLAPTAYPQVIRGRPGTTVKLLYHVLEDSQKSSEIVRIFDGGKRLALIRTRMQRTAYSKPHSVKWKIPSNLHSSALRFCVVAKDPAGHTSRSACAPIQTAG